jgi:hypothetical protein
MIQGQQKSGGKLFFAVGYPEVAPWVHLTVLRSVNAVTVSHPVQCVFKMAVLIPNPAKGKVCSVIYFLRAKGETATEMHRQLISVYGEVMNRQNMAK